MSARVNPNTRVVTVGVLVSFLFLAPGPHATQVNGGSRQGRTAMMDMPQLRPLPTPQAVVDEHLDALNKGDWRRLMAQYPEDIELFLPHGLTVRGRTAVGEAFLQMTKPFKDGGLLGVTFTAEHVFVVGGTVSAQWRVDADFLREPYRGADAYVTRDGLLAAQVSTFEMTALKALVK